ELQEAIASSTVPRTLSIDISAARIGDVRVVTFPLEVYSEMGLELRRKFHPKPLIIAGYTNGLYGYAPTDLAIDQGGYGPATSHRFFPHLLTPLGRGTAQALISASGALLRWLGSS